MLDSVDVFCFQLLVKILETGGFNVDTVKVAEAWRKYLCLLIFRNALLYPETSCQLCFFGYMKSFPVTRVLVSPTSTCFAK